MAWIAVLCSVTGQANTSTQKNLMKVKIKVYGYRVVPRDTLEDVKLNTPTISTLILGFRSNNCNHQDT
jgi:hypothetical protein